jgi:hypothetical protein
MVEVLPLDIADGDGVGNTTPRRLKNSTLVTPEVMYSFRSPFLVKCQESTPFEMNTLEDLERSGIRIRLGIR